MSKLQPQKEFQQEQESAESESSAEDFEEM